MICIMHQAEPYGHLVVNGLAIAPDTLARMVGASKREALNWLAELETAGVFNRDGETIVSRRMVRDEALRKVRAEGGKLGGNPALKDSRKVTNKVNHTPNLQPTPSVFSLQSSASETSKSTAIAQGDKSPSLAGPVNGDAVAYIPIVGGTEFGVSKELLAELEAAYPMVDGPQTLKEIRAWCITNPARRKTARGAPRFINRWFEQVQNRG